MIKINESDYKYYRDNYNGICLKCKAIADCCEPDARNYQCEECTCMEVYGIEELFIMDELDISFGD